MDIITKIKTRPKDNATEILVLVSHPMDTGQQTDPTTKEKIPAHFITQLTVSLNGKPIAVTNMAAGISKDPLFGLLVKNTKPGDKVTASWVDNKNQQGRAETVIGQ